MLNALGEVKLWSLVKVSEDNMKKAVNACVVFMIIISFVGCTSVSYIPHDGRVVDRINYPEIGVEAAANLGSRLAAKGYIVEEAGIEFLSNHKQDFRSEITAGKIARLSHMKVNSYSGALCYTLDEPRYWYLYICESKGRWYILGQDGTLLGEIDGNAIRKTTLISKHEPSFVQELIYNGRAGNVVKFIYREFSDNMIRPAFTQEAQYDLASSSIVGFKDLRLEILDASNTEIRYRLLNNFH